MSATTHVRQHNSMLAASEKRVLVWIASRLPRWINSDHLSALGLAAMAGAGVSFYVAQVDPVAGASLVVLCLLLNWFGDSLDGTVARVRNQQRPRYGYYVDHVIDLAGTALLFAGLAASGYMTPLIATLVVAAFFLVSAETYLATHARGVFKMAFLGVGPTELRILMAAGAIALITTPDGQRDWPWDSPAVGPRRGHRRNRHGRHVPDLVAAEHPGALHRGDCPAFAAGGRYGAVSP